MRVRFLLNIVKHKTNELILVKLMTFKIKTNKIVTYFLLSKKYGYKTTNLIWNVVLDQEMSTK